MKIAIVAPSSPFNKNLLLEGVNKIKREGFEIVYNERIFKRGWERVPYLVGSPRERAEEIIDYFTDTTVSAIISARGGYGSNLVTPYLDFNKITKNPKIFMGFSDLTYILNSIYERTGIVTFHGPMIATYKFCPMIKDDFETFKKILLNPTHEINIHVEENQIYNPKSFSGVVVGGNLSILTTMIGTKFDFTTKGKVLFIEDINETNYKIDRMLSHMKQAGKLENLAGIIIGEMLACGTTYDQIIEILKSLSVFVPVITDFPAGHGCRNVVVPIGGECNFDINSKTISLRG